MIWPGYGSRRPAAGKKETQNINVVGKTAGGQTNNRFRWQGPLGKTIFVLFCFGIRRDEEKESQNINVSGKCKDVLVQKVDSLVERVNHFCTRTDQSLQKHARAGFFVPRRRHLCSHNIYVLGLLCFVPANATAEY